jgi:PhnO protein
MRYQLADWTGQVIGMIGLHMQFHLHHAGSARSRSWW